MISQCQKCHARLTDFAVSCEKCGWSIINTASSNSNGSKTTTKPPSKDEELPVIIVENGANSNSLVPVDRSTEEVLPPEDNRRSSIDEMPPLEIDLQIQKAMDLIEQENFKSALSYLNRAIIDVPPERLAECFSLRGYVHLKNLDFVRAENDCTQAINQHWEDAQTYAWRAASRGEQNKWRSAFDDLERACELAGNQRDQYLGLMESYSETASNHYREQIQAGMDSAEVFFERGWIYFRSGKYQKAERDFKHALSQEPAHPWASVGLARLRFDQGKFKGVRKLCGAAIQGDSACESEALEIRAQLNSREGNIASAQKDLDRLIELAGDNSKRLVECCRLRSNIGDHVKAIAGLTEVLTSNPEHHLASLIRGDCYREIKNYSLAIADYSRYLRFYPDDVKALVRRANMLLATKRNDLAHADLDDALELDKTNFDSYLIRSRLHLQDKKLDQALTECQKAVRLDNQKPEVFGVLASIYQGLCDYSAAIEEFSRSAQLAIEDNDKATFLYRRGACYYEMEEFDKADEDFQQACKLRPNHAGSWIWRAATCSRIEKWHDAILGLQKAISIRPTAADQYQKLGKPVAERAIAFFNNQQQRGKNEVDLFRNRGLAFQFLGKNTEAIKDYSIALQHAPDDAETLIRRGQILAKQGNHTAANEDFTKVIRADANNHAARYWRAISRSADGNLEEARSDISKAIKLNGKQPSYHILSGELTQKAGDTKKVIRAFDRAITHDPNDATTYRRRGAAHIQAQNYLNAISDFTHAFELQPSQTDVLVQRGHAYLKADQIRLAIEDFELALTHNDKLARAYSGRAAALVIEKRFEYALIWLTKAIHRFSTPRELAEIMFARGKVFYQMGRLTPACADFSSVIDLMRSDIKTVAAARYARGVANFHAEKWEKAAKDFRKLLKITPNDTAIQQALAWLADHESEKPAFLQESNPFRRPTRPPVIRNGVRLVESIEKWEMDPPHDSWVVRSEDKKEYGPVQYGILQTWIKDGRIGIGMKLLRADWSKWKRAEKIFSEISPVNSAAIIDAFPGINIK
ncbi:MAG: tetratricopeptide repeat protein [Mariniblastus sp.]|nr:tetratricopeptide repeat protein [Mariniblastus sp.]